MPFKICQKGSVLPKKAGLRREANLTPPAIWDLTWSLTIGLISDFPLTTTLSVDFGVSHAVGLTAAANVGITPAT